jgi:plasmid replication initiation protein
MISQNTKARLLKPKTEVEIPERAISMSNALARGAQGLNLSQKRIIALALAFTDSVSVRDAVAGNMNGWTVRLFAGDYAQTYEVDLDTAYTQLRTGARSLLKCLWRTVGVNKRGTPVIVEGQWLSLAKYTPNEGRVDITFHPHVSPHLLALRKQFTTYKLRQAAALRSIYAWRLFECLQSWKTKGIWVVDISEFHKIMEVPESCISNFKDLRKRVVEPAVRELIEKDGMRIEWQAIKAGRKVSGLEFKFGRNDEGIKQNS